VEKIIRPAQLVELGRREFAEVWEIQKDLVEKRKRDEIPDTLILVEHENVVTVGRRLHAEQHIHAREMPIFEIERGGDVTWHGPGQLVGYPIVKLDENERDLHAYLRNLEAGLIAVCEKLGVPAGRKPDWTGVWVGDAARKVASIGIAVRRWVTMHGFALNVAVDLRAFAAIDPCGLPASVMTSLDAEAKRAVTVEEIAPLVAAEISRALGREFSRPRGS
jgi:lipoyl(octanoyl) transferase